MLINRATISSKGINKLISHKEELGYLFQPFLIALMLKDYRMLHGTNTENRIIAESGYGDTPCLDSKEQEIYEKMLHMERPEYYKKSDIKIDESCIWQPYNASANMHALLNDCASSDRDMQLKRDMVSKFISVCNSSDIPADSKYFFSYMRDVKKKHNELIYGLIRHQGILRRYMKGEVGECEMLVFMAIVIGEMWKRNKDLTDEYASGILDKFAIYFDCVDADYLEPVPKHYVMTNRETLEEINANKHMPLDKRIKRMEIKPSALDENMLDFVRDTTFIGGQEFFYRHSANITNKLLSMIKNKAGHQDSVVQPYYVLMGDIADKSIYYLSNGGTCLYRHSYLPDLFPLGNSAKLKVKVYDKYMYLRLKY